MRSFAIFFRLQALAAVVAACILAFPHAAAAQASVTVSTVGQLYAAVDAASMSGGPTDIRIRAGEYVLLNVLDLYVTAGHTATLRAFGDGPVILSTPETEVLRTGYLASGGSYIVRGLTFRESRIAVNHYAGDIRIEDSTFIENNLSFYTDSSNANVTIINSTFWRNGGICGAQCGGVWLDGHRSASIVNSTFLETTNAPAVHGLDLLNGSGPEVLANSILLNNQRDCDFSSPGPTVVASIDSDGSCASASTYSPISQPLDTGFGDHGGLVATWASTLVPNPVTGAGAATQCPAYDARGSFRAASCDIGAYEPSRGFRVESAVGAGPVAVQVSSGSLTDFHAILPGQLPTASLPAGVTFPFGLFDWTARGLVPGQSVAVTMTFPSAVPLPLRYFKGDASGGPWTDICQQITCSQPAPNQLTFTLVDGGVGDLDGVANGRILDPGGIGIGGDPGPRPNLAISKSLRSGTSLVNALTVDAGANAVFHLAISNTGAGPTTGAVTVTDSLDANLSFVAQDSDARCSAVGSLVTCVASSTMAAGAIDSFDVAVRVAADAAPAGGSIAITNVADVSTPGDADASDNGSNAVTLTAVAPPPPNTPPTLSLPAPITAEAAGAAGAVVTFSVTANDVQDGVVAASCTPASGAQFPLGVTTVSCTATDSRSETTTGTFTVTVVDTTPPAIVTPGNLTRTVTGTTGVAVTYSVTANDLVSNVIVPTCAPASGSVFAIGTSTVTCAAQDAAGNRATAAFTVTVVSSDPGPQAPAITRIFPDSGWRGTYAVILIQGSRLGSRPTLQISGSDIRILEVVPFNATTAGALIYIKPGAARGARSLTISNEAGTSNPVTFTVR